MDRWGDGDGLDRGPKAPMTGVSKMGMSAFIKSSGGSSATPEEQPAKIQVVASKREQKRAQMPPPPPAMQPARAVQQPANPGGFRAPDWAGTPPGAARLDVLKDGQVIDSISLEQPATVFGRSPTADVVLDHPSLSRQHAAVCFNRLRREWVVLDLNSAHGTQADGRPAAKGSPVQLIEGSILRFAASSREYVLRQGAAGNSEAHHHSAAVSNAEPPGKRRKAVQWPDEATAAAEQSGQQLEKVIGYSDGGEFASRVGPQPVQSGDGRFADLVQSKVVSAKDKERQQQEQAQEAGDQEQQQQRQQQQEKPAAKRRHTEEATRRHIAQPLLKQSMYDFLPAPSQSSAQPS